MNVKLVCELCYNHLGNINRAIEIIDAFSFCDVFKFQKMEPRVFLSKARYREKCVDSVNYFGETYGEHREYLELSIEDHRELKSYIEAMGKKYACSACDIPSAEKIIPLNPYYVKIPSCRCNNFALIDYCLANFDGFVHVSTGMTTRAERRKVLMKSNNIIAYTCASNYDNAGDVYIERMRGFSCHVPDIFYGMAAIMNGARFIEYHCTIDRSFPGSDQKISLLPSEYKDLRKWMDKHRDKFSRIRFERPELMPGFEAAARRKLWSTA